MTHHDPALGDSEDRFYAQFDSREVKLMTLDELQGSFEAGEIHENTFVCREGESEWLTLAIVAGLGDEDAEVEEELRTEPVAAERRPAMPNRIPEGAELRPPMPNRVPAGAELRPPMPNRIPEGAEHAPLSPRAAEGSGLRPPMPNRVPQTLEMRPPMPNRRPEMPTEPATWQSSPFPTAVPAAAAAPKFSPLSYGPVTSNIDSDELELDDLALRPKRRWGRVFGVAAALLVVGGGGAFAASGGLHHLPFVTPSLSTQDSSSDHSQASLTLTNVEAKAASPTPAEAPAPPAPEPVAETPPPVASDAAPSSSAAPGLSDDMKQALLASDKTNAAKHAQKAKARATSPAAHHSRAATNSTGFKSGGSAYDPLNGKL